MSDDDMLEWRPQSTPWENWHKTISSPIEGVYIVRYPLDNPRYGAPAINRCTKQIQRALAEAKANNFSARVVGNGWSLSKAPVVNGALLDVSRLSGLKPIQDNQIDPGYPGDANERAGLWLIQCGAFISKINRTIEKNDYGRSLRTSGAANGQTVIGASSTGTHGSALTFGAFHDHIVAVHLLAGDQKQYWIERASRPVLKPSLSGTLGAVLRRDDALFNAVVLGLGAFGVIQNVIIETRPRFLLEAKNFDSDGAGAPLKLDAAMRTVIETLDFSNHPVLRDPAGRQPYFFQPIIDPNTADNEVLATVMYETPWQPGYRPNYNMSESSFGPGYDFLSVAGRLLDIAGPLVPVFSKVASGALFDATSRTGSWGEIFGYKAPRTKVASGSVAVPLDRALDTLDALIELNDDIGPAPLVFGCRYVKKSPALLAMNRFDTTFVVSVDGVFNNTSLQFFDAIPAKMDAAGIPFTQHWGKTNGYTPARTAAAFGADLTAWKDAREDLLPDPADRALFTNDYMRERGLDS
jgi:FAD/FMN-containing dehydrogenase